MSITISACPSCQDSLAVGFIRDRGHSNLSIPAEWIDGKPEKRRFLDTIKISGRERRPVVAIRCTKCNHLLLLAPDTDMQ